MLAGFIATVLMVGLASAPLLWRVRQDRREARADAIRADANAALFRRFGGESLVAVHVRPSSLWRAGRVELILQGLDGGVQLAVHDDGVGFDPAVERGRPSLGHSSMRERTHLVGGEIDIESAPGHGTTIVAWVPLGGGMS